MVFIIFGVSTPVKFVSFRIAVFNSTVVDYLGISFRTLSHYPAQTNRSALDTLSYLLACFTLSCFTLELCYMGWVVNCLHGRSTKRMSITEKNMREVMFDGLNPVSINQSWFVRNYNLLYLLRFFTFMSFLFGLQYLQIFQALFSFVLMISFTILTIYYQLTVGLFDSFSSSIVKIIQECSIAVIMILVNTFCLDSFKGIISSKAKTAMVMIFMVLLLLNIVLEVLSVIISIILLCTQPKKLSPEEAAKKNYKNNNRRRGQVLDLPTPSNRGRSKVRMKRKRNNRNYFKEREKKIKDKLMGFMEDRQEIKLMPSQSRRASGKRRMIRNHRAKHLMSRKNKTKRIGKK